ncbi:MAG: YdcF family protein [Pseudomonadota bacterium]
MNSPNPAVTNETKGRVRPFQGAGSHKSLPGKPLRHLLSALILLPVLLFTLEAGYFAWVLFDDETLEKADLIVVFEGAAERPRAAYNLLDRSFADSLLVSPATEARLVAYEKRFAPSLPYTRVMEEKARTTFENALNSATAITQTPMRSVILVTSWDHMPRSHFLFRVMTLGSGLQVQPYFVPTGRLGRTTWHQHTTAWKMVFNEMLKLWGSLYEFARYRLSGDLTGQVPGGSRLAGRLKQALLFEIDHHSLN